MAMEAVSTSVTSASFHETTQSNIPEDSHLHTRRPESLKSQLNQSRYVTKLLSYVVSHVSIKATEYASYIYFCLFS
jgi:hypothetical protein